MRRKRLFEKETGFSDSFISSLEYSFTDGDNSMKRNKQAQSEAYELETFKKARKKVFSGGVQ